MRHNDVIDAGQNNRLFDPGTDMDWERLRLSHMQKGAYCKGTYYVQVCDNDRLITDGHWSNCSIFIVLKSRHDGVNINIRQY